MNLRIPGPTPCPDPVRKALSKQMINHRGKEFGQIINKITAQLKQLFQTSNDLFILTGSGTGVMEAAVVNTLSPGDRVLGVCNGFFGERFADIADVYGAKTSRLRFEWGTAAAPDAIAKALAADPSIKAVLVTHNETSTGVTSDLEAISRVVKGAGKLLIVDAISSIGSIELPVDRWRCDVVVTGSQKGFMVPPGLAFISFSEEAWKANKEARMPRNYWDLGKAKSYLARGQTPWTPAVSIFFALDVALDMMLKEGLTNIIARHQRVGKLTRDGVRALGLPVFADEKYASNTVTAVKVPEGLDCKKLLKILEDEHDIELSGGQERLEGKIFRIGHLGYVNEADIDDVIKGLRAALLKVGFEVPAEKKLAR